MLTLAGMGAAAVWGVKWMLKSGQMHAKRDEPLTPTDLKVLEESAARLVSDITAAADEAVARVERALSEAERRIADLESRQIALGAHYAQAADPTSATNTVPAMPASNSYEISSADESPAQVARQSGMTTGEVELLRGLRQMALK